MLVKLSFQDRGWSACDYRCFIHYKKIFLMKPDVALYKSTMKTSWRISRVCDRHSNVTGWKISLPLNLGEQTLITDSIEINIFFMVSKVEGHLNWWWYIAKKTTPIMLTHQRFVSFKLRGDSSDVSFNSSFSFIRSLETVKALCVVLWNFLTLQ